MSKTQENLLAAFAGESQANRKYLAFAKQAYKEGLPQVAKLFRAAAVPFDPRCSLLEAAIAGETHEFTQMYPEMIKEAQAENNAAVARYFDFANKVEEVHANLYKKALENPAAMPNVDYYVCSVCGYTHEGPVDKCPICGAAAAAFEKIA